jgi:hypothetical protein
MIDIIISKKDKNLSEKEKNELKDKILNKTKKETNDEITNSLKKLLKGNKK